MCITNNARKKHNKTAQLEDKEIKTPNKTHVTIKKKCVVALRRKKKKDCELNENLLLYITQKIDFSINKLYI